jgi:cytochrome c5
MVLITVKAFSPFSGVCRSAGLILLTLSLVAETAGAAAPHGGLPEGTTGFWEEFHRPPESYQGPPRSGQHVYEYRCKSCHGRATQGAPMPGDELEWERRSRQGMVVLMDHVKHGFKEGLMPPLGGCANCSDAELRAAVLYMLEKSSIKQDKIKP